MRRTQEGFVPFKDDKTKYTENSQLEARSALIVKASIYQINAFFNMWEVFLERFLHIFF